jgi:hypothetical protein
MIPFFRKIRYQLAKDNQFLKYSRYAIGEIVLVVVGILIALQINNWQQNRKNDEARRNYYHQLLHDLEKDRILIEGFLLEIDSFEVRLQSYKEIFKQPDLPIWQITNEMRKVFLSDGVNVKVNNNAITTLQNTGDIKLIPPLVRNKILDFKYKQAGIMDFVSITQQNIVNHTLHLSELWGGDLVGRSENQPKLVKHYNDENIQIQSLMGLEANLYSMSEALKKVEKRFKDLLLDAQEIKTIINQELKK